MSKEISIQCFTNLDDYKGLTWPTKLPTVPRVGDHIAARSGKKLCVVSLTWQFDGTLEVELHQPFSARPTR